MASDIMGSKFYPQIQPETNMESFLDDPAFLEYCITGIDRPNLTGLRCLTDISQTQNRCGKSKGNKELNLSQFVNSHVPTIENSLFSNAELSYLHKTNEDQRIQFADVVQHQGTPILSQEIYEVENGQHDETYHIEPLRPMNPCEDFQEITSDPVIARDPEVLFHMELTQTDMTLIRDVVQQNSPPSLILPEDMIVADFMATGNQKPAQENHRFDNLQLDVTQVVDKTDMIVNQLKLGNAEVLCFIPDQSQEPILADTLQFEGCQIPSTVVEGINSCKSQQRLQNKPDENTLPMIWQEKPARRGRGRPRSDSSKSLSSMVQTQLVIDPKTSVYGERRSKLVCKNNLKSIVNEINIEQLEDHEYSQAAGRKRKLSTSSTASTSSSSYEENRNPNNKNNIASKKSRDKKKEQERQTQIELEELEKKNEQLNNRLEKINWALKQVQAVVMPAFSPKQ